MADILCVVCGEPWDAYGARNGDMEKWEYELFRKGSGCPCCEGKPPNGKHFEPKTISDIEFGDEDPVLRLNAWEDSIDGKTPKWEKPEPKVFWQCDGCGVQVIGNPSFNEKHEDYLEYHIPHDAKCNKWHNSHPFWRGNPEKEPAHIFHGGEKVCEYCLDHCARCGKEVSGTLEIDDIYDDGCSFPHPYNYHDCICIDCQELTCCECGNFPEDCECNQDNEEDNDND